MQKGNMYVHCTANADLQTIIISKDACISFI